MRVVKCRVGEYTKLVAEVPGFVYCGRGFRDYPASMLGNPYSTSRDGDLATVIAKFRRWLHERVAEGGPVHEALGLLTENAVLGCWCVNDDAPETSTLRGQERCHCQVLAKAWQSLRK